MEIPEILLQEAAKRGATAEEFLGRLLHLFAIGDQEARELFEDWDKRPREEQIRWCLDFARERVRLEYPYLDEGEENDG